MECEKCPSKKNSGNVVERITSQIKINNSLMDECKNTTDCKCQKYWMTMTTECSCGRRVCLKKCRNEHPKKIM